MGSFIAQNAIESGIHKSLMIGCRALHFSTVLPNPSSGHTILIPLERASVSAPATAAGQVRPPAARSSLAQPAAARREDRFRSLPRPLLMRNQIARLNAVAQHRLPVGCVRAQCGHIGQRIILQPLTGDMTARARSGPVLGMRDQPGRHRILFHIAHRRHQMRVIRRIAGEATLKQITAPFLPKIDVPRVPPMRFTQSRRQSIPILRQEDQVNMIVHQAPRQTTDTRRGTALCHQIEIKTPVHIPKKDRQPPIAPLRNMMRNFRNDEASEPGHALG